EGILLTCCDTTLMQLRTRRPLLLDAGALDSLPYAPESGPEMAKILEEIYGIDFFNPPEEVRMRRPWAQIPTAWNRRVWEARTTEQWRGIRRKFGVTQVITYAGWELALPRVASNDEYSLYSIPE
ncbi:MAG: hypothetical protein HYX74_00815, partial [Acidobacteria bacterium]|nr:hypothetical protein [Acidobacteriota bacterium]